MVHGPTLTFLEARLIPHALPVHQIITTAPNTAQLLFLVLVCTCTFISDTERLGTWLGKQRMPSAPGAGRRIPSLPDRGLAVHLAGPEVSGIVERTAETAGRTGIMCLLSDKITFVASN